MHGKARPRPGVVGLVVQAVHVAVQERPDVALGEAGLAVPPWVHRPVYEEEVDAAPLRRQGQGKEEPSCPHRPPHQLRERAGPLHEAAPSQQLRGLEVSGPAGRDPTAGPEVDHEALVQRGPHKAADCEEALAQQVAAILVRVRRVVAPLLHAVRGQGSEEQLVPELVDRCVDEEVSQADPAHPAPGEPNEARKDARLLGRRPEEEPDREPDAEVEGVAAVHLVDARGGQRSPRGLASVVGDGLRPLRSAGRLPPAQGEDRGRMAEGPHVAPRPKAGGRLPTSEP
mmetsp:Transcript_57932/g.116141  ORF Transcript_57932/g.116141 Transcript_57932/m.116141 type:complete len:285 (+) Transcript_57932:419-1273(+)